MAMVVYDPENQDKARTVRRFLPILSALAFVLFVATAVVLVAVLGPENSGVPPAIAFSESTPQEIELGEDESLEIELDPEGGAQGEFEVESVEGPATAEIDDTTLVLEPEQDASGTVTVVVTSCTDEGCDSTRIVAEVVARNDPPFANFDEAELAGGEQVVSIPVLDNDSDVDDSTLEILEAELVEGQGRVVIVEDRTVLEFSTPAATIGPWTITYVVTDGSGGFAQGTVTVSDSNLEPQPEPDEVSALIGEQIRISPLENDSDDGGREELRIVEVSEPRLGTAEFGPDWIDFISGSEPGVVAFTYVVADAKGQQSSETVTVNVSPPALALVNDIATTDEDTAVDVNVLANDGPAEASIDPQTLTVVSSSSGTVSAGGGQISYDPPPDAVGIANIIYEVCSEFGECGQASLQITVNSVIDGAFSADGEIRVPSIAGPQLIPWLAVSGEATPPAGSLFQISTDDRSLFSSAPTIGRNGALNFTPAPGQRGTTVARITATDPVNGERVFAIRLVVT